MIERFIRWQIRVFLRGFHLHRDPSPHKLTTAINFPKEGTDGNESIFAPGSAGRSIDS